MIQSRYKDQDPKGCKKENNIQLIAFVKECYDDSFLREKGFALYLDGPCLGSTRIFHGIFNRCIIPQMDNKDYLDMIGQNLPTHIEIQNKTARNIIEKEPEKVAQCQCIYLDTMQIVYGSIEKKSYPMHDFDQILKVTKQKKIIIGLTFVSRMYRLKKLYHDDDEPIFPYERISTKEMFNEFLHPIIRSRGFCVKKIYVNEYCKDIGKCAPMVFFAMILEKHFDKIVKELFHMHPCKEFRIGFDQTFKDEIQKVKKSSVYYKKMKKHYYNETKGHWVLPRKNNSN